MKNSVAWPCGVLLVLLIATAWAQAPAQAAKGPAEHGTIVGAWRSQIRFRGGPFVDLKDLEFMYVYNAGGTLTESSNYDGAPPVPPAYGIWRQTGPNRFQTRYVFYITKAPASFQDITTGGGWSPDGHGVFTEEITVAADGRSYTSAVSYAAFDVNGKPVAGSGQGTGSGTRITF